MDLSSALRLALLDFPCSSGAAAHSFGSAWSWSFACLPLLGPPVGVILCLAGTYFLIPWVRLPAPFVAPSFGSPGPSSVRLSKYLHERHC